eukprot:TRINITY_DN17463_c0_g1_i3.p1 TRINITY_DN17463_c0_g1~~TRINITY_DN17463_c0_g1_i3.p1  ORF type:complete len:162 (+),score=26.08 TRINITY_DN17463_c0_g1_i3:25-486(+)
MPGLPCVPTSQDFRERTVYHGCHPANVMRITTNGLLRVGHPLNPSSSTDAGYFGDPRFGVYVSQYPDYTLKYTNGLKYPDLGERLRIIMLRAIPGKAYQFPTWRPGVLPTPGFDSHLSSQGQEWFLFDETQCCPQYVLEVEVIVNTRKCGDDK